MILRISKSLSSLRGRMTRPFDHEQDYEAAGKTPIGGNPGLVAALS